MAYFGFKNLSSLSNVDMTIYRYVTQHQEQVVYMRVRDIAKNAHVSNSSVMRFIHKIGFSSFPAFKSYIKSTPNIQESPTNSFHFINKSSFPDDIEEQVTVVADFLFQCDNIITFGIGNSGFIAAYAARKMANIGFNTMAITDSTYPIPNKLANTSNNAIICFSVSGETPELIEGLNPFVNNQDTAIISITGNKMSTISRMSKFSLSYQEPETRINKFYDLSSQIPAVYIAEAITSLMEKESKL
ncbi:MurR/RpiR family transcriptional regulator [Lactobacillus helveticus]|uniref:MurR/RpiR family transcriptional regulator n=2 Tax=Lactobacillus helveticus TaxID=1587 RepID=UPI000D7CBCDC|nr:MurR/RpiR family transcriptional regulator [Lactobacillus helveticus]MBW7987798.1 MurR/RpiR family transcriptional regulator [Lactobacillus helveticus]NRO67415.1 HTH-type transcriptional regulator GlvR [Lactobacillus helveticus]NRO69365.1 HTH-type transcriptional regulator GlvR [Lactobacillus helveticus]PXZ18498.1 MurR/RpiR family transcriptional regulator [Lactobacillus helveticus]TLQ19230.1 MurR/RpiR family transcriptional regulator [Lactobacillus helveticus]